MKSNGNFNNNDYGSSALLDCEKKKEMELHDNDATDKGDRSTTFNQQIDVDSLSNSSDKNKKVIVRIVTVFSIIFFCVSMLSMFIWSVVYVEWVTDV